MSGKALSLSLTFGQFAVGNLWQESHSIFSEVCVVWLNFEYFDAAFFGAGLGLAFAFGGVGFASASRPSPFFEKPGSMAPKAKKSAEATMAALAIVLFLVCKSFIKF